MASSGERPYTETDLTGNKSSLVKFVQCQMSKWPGERKFQPTKVTVPELKSALLDPAYGFTTNQTLVQSPRPPKLNTRQTGAVGRPSTIVNQRVEAPVNTSGAGHLETIEVRVYVEDSRCMPAQKTVAILPIPVLDRNCNPGSFRVLSKELISALQKSNGAIEIPRTGSGTVKISFPDSEDEDWKIPFARITHGQALDAVNFNPEALEIPEDRRFKLFADNVFASSSLAKDEAVNTDSMPVSSLGPSGPNESAPEVSTDPAVEFLRGKLQTRDGFQVFLANRGRVVTNPEAVKDWQFAVDFTRDYDKLKSPVKVTRKAIQAALQIGSTWFSQAHTSIEIIRKYGEVKEVSDVLKEVDEPQGSTQLYKFLKNYKDTHHM
ncbi:hypothetical protein GGX14DRAFT_669435 [Mycena pura]|uniref:Uncharacterized protein n=1 Tax=Mycena pura TaxID=153505 RepID=A0AAD6VSE0_9AGAR|nr:hypothetical protein GGX14DRAFT_669435 [Mycena pura]